jgi:hypothetical protein
VQALEELEFNVTAVKWNSRILFVSYLDWREPLLVLSQQHKREQASLDNLLALSSTTVAGYNTMPLDLHY